eukprot:scaffold58738_cov48-Phaeocystis_antarctica.AAC.2
MARVEVQTTCLGAGAGLASGLGSGLGLGLGLGPGLASGFRVRVRVRVSRDDLRAVLPEAEHDADRGDAPVTKPRLSEQSGFSCARGCPVRHLGSASLGPSASWAMLAPRPYGVCFSTG